MSSAFSERQRSAAQLLIRYSAERVELLAAALVRLLAIILIVAAAILLCPFSIQISYSCDDYSQNAHGS